MAKPSTAADMLEQLASSSPAKAASLTTDIIKDQQKVIERVRFKIAKEVDRRGEQQLASGLVFEDDVKDPNDVGFDLKALAVAGRESQINPATWADPSGLQETAVEVE